MKADRQPNVVTGDIVLDEQAVPVERVRDQRRPENASLTVSHVEITHHRGVRYTADRKHFYRAMQCVSAVFAVSRCLSIRHVRVLYSDG